MNDRLRLPLRFDAEAMLADVLGLEPIEWIEHFVKDNYEGSWSVLPLRAAAGATHPVQMIYSDPAAESFHDSPLLGRCPSLQRALAKFCCPLQSVRLMKLTPGSRIKPHSDHDLSPEFGRARLHIPITTNPAVDFLLNGEPVVMRAGECWYLRLADTHSVFNGGESDRIHLVVDAVVDPWLEEMLRRSEEPAARSSSPDSVCSDLHAFREAVLADSSLQQRLDRIEERTAFIAEVLRAASELGFRLDAIQIEAAMQQRIRDWHQRAL